LDSNLKKLTLKKEPSERRVPFLVCQIKTFVFERVKKRRSGKEKKRAQVLVEKEALALTELISGLDSTAFIILIL